MRRVPVRSIRIDDDVWDELKRRAEPLEDTPNAVLRRALGLDSATPKVAPPASSREAVPPVGRSGGRSMVRQPRSELVERTRNGRLSRPFLGKLLLVVLLRAGGRLE